jgi:hypothetical protein
MINTTVNKAVDINNTKLLPDKKQAYLRTGEYFIQNGNIDKNQLDLALNIQKVTKERIGRILINLGLISRDKLTEYLYLFYNNLRHRSFVYGNYSPLL